MLGELAQRQMGQLGFRHLDALFQVLGQQLAQHTEHAGGCDHPQRLRCQVATLLFDPLRHGTTEVAPLVTGTSGGPA